MFFYMLLHLFVFFMNYCTNLSSNAPFMG